MSAQPRQPGWYIARKIVWGADVAPVVVRVSTDTEGGCSTVWEIGRRDPSTLSDWKLVFKVNADGSTTDLDLDRLQKEAWADGRKTGVLEERRKQAGFDAARDRDNPIITVDLPDADSDFREAGEPIIAIRMTLPESENLSHGLSDLLCWAQGFNAALGDDTGRSPMGIETVRRIREVITKAQRAVEKA